jgi:hypothetical protein
VFSVANPRCLYVGFFVLFRVLDVAQRLRIVFWVYVCFLAVDGVRSALFFLLLMIGCWIAGSGEKCGLWSGGERVEFQKCQEGCPQPARETVDYGQPGLSEEIDPSSLISNYIRARTSSITRYVTVEVIFRHILLYGRSTALKGNSHPS